MQGQVICPVDISLATAKWMKPRQCGGIMPCESMRQSSTIHIGRMDPRFCRKREYSVKYDQLERRQLVLLVPAVLVNFHSALASVPSGDETSGTNCSHGEGRHFWVATITEIEKGITKGNVACWMMVPSLRLSRH